MKIREIYDYLNRRFPESLREAWDNDGIMLCPDRERKIKRIITTLDITEEVARFAIEEKADLIISHHPLIFHPLKSLDSADAHSAIILSLALSGISAISLHTRFDMADGGLNDALAERLGASKTEKFGLPEDNYSLGRTFEVDCTALEFCRFASERLGHPVHLWSDGSKPIKKAGIVSGGGKDYIASAKACGCDLFLTGDISYSAAISAREIDIAIADAGHFATEVISAEVFKKILEECSDELEIIRFCPNLGGEIIFGD